MSDQQESLPSASTPNKRNVSLISKQEQEPQSIIEHEPHSKKLKAEEKSAVASSSTLVTSTIEKPKRAEDLRTLSHEQILQLAVKEIFPFSTFLYAIKKNWDDHINNYPLNALAGPHLYHAIQVYYKCLRSGGTEKAATQDIVEYLMSNEKVTDEDVANFIAHWLYETYIAIQEKETRLIEWSDPEAVLDFFRRNGIKKRDTKFKIVSTFGEQFPLVARKSQVEQFLYFILSQIENENQLDKSFHPIPFCAAGPGSGKSRLNQDMMVCIKSKLQEFMNQDESAKQKFFTYDKFNADKLRLLEQHYTLINNAESVLITLGNGTSFKSSDIDFVEQSISFRILHSYFNISEYIQEDFELSRYMNHFSKYFRNNLLLVDVLKLIKHSVGEDKLVIYLGIDEFNKVDSEPEKLVLKKYLDLVGGVMCQSLHRVILVPFFTGTSFDSIDTLISKSTHPPISFALPIFSLADMKAITGYLATKYLILQYFEVNATFLFYLYKIGQVPRAIEYFFQTWLSRIDEFYELNEPTIRTVYTIAKNDFKSRYTSSPTTISFLPYAILHKEIPSNLLIGATDLFEKGIIQLQNTQKIENIPEILLPSQNYAQNEMVWFNEPNDWANWEKFCLLCFVMKVNSYLQLNQTTASIKEIFNTSTMSKQFYTTISKERHYNLNFKLVKLQYKSLGLQIDSKFINQHSDINTVYLNGIGGKAIDGFTILEDDSKKQWFIIFQMKHTSDQAKVIPCVSSTVLEKYYKKIDNIMKDTKFKDSYICIFPINRPHEHNLQIPENRRIVVVAKQDLKSYFPPFFFHNSLILAMQEMKYLKINSCLVEDLTHVVTKHFADNIIKNRPIKSKEELKAVLGTHVRAIDAYNLLQQLEISYE